MNARITHRTGFTYLDLMTLLIVLPLLMMVLLTACENSSSTAYRVKCASNLRLIAQAIALYANENGAHYPRTVYAPGPSVLPVFGTGVNATNPFAPGGPEPNDVTAAMFLLMRTQNFGSEVFICPTSALVRDDFGGGPNTALSRSNFSDYRKNCSYSLVNPYPDDAAVAAKYDLKWDSLNPDPLAPQFAIAADVNPGIKGNNDNVLGLTTASTQTQMSSGNSNNHRKDGQNVVFADGHVTWTNTPFSGVQRDNIYTNKNAQVIASPVDADDSVLLPTDD